MTSESSTPTGSLVDLMDRVAIQDLLARYCRGVDRADVGLINSCYAADATCEFGPLLLRGTEIGEAVGKASRDAVICHHMTGNQVIELHGDVAHAETYFLATVVSDERSGRHVRTRAGRYVDRLERVDGGWGIRERVVVQDWGSFEPLEELPAEGSFRQGRNSDDDPLYSLIGPRTP
jgi:hypothetical protein